MHMPVTTWFSYLVLTHLLSFQQKFFSISWNAIASNRAGNMLATKEMLVQDSFPIQNRGKHLGLSHGQIVRLLAVLWGCCQRTCLAVLAHAGVCWPSPEYFTPIQVLVDESCV